MEHSYIGQLLRLIRFIEDSFLALLLTGMIGLATMQILLRNVFDSGWVWADPLLRLLVLWVGLAGAMVATREDKHISIDIITRALSPAMQQISLVFTNLFAGTVSAIIAYHASRLVIMDYEDATIAFADVPSWLCELIIPLAFGVIALRYGIHTLVHTRQFLNRQVK